MVDAGSGRIGKGVLEFVGMLSVRDDDVHASLEAD
jgi:hypothetical protein